MGVKLLFGGVDSVADAALDVAEAAGSPVELETRGEDEPLVTSITWMDNSLII